MISSFVLNLDKTEETYIKINKNDLKQKINVNQMI